MSIRSWRRSLESERGPACAGPFADHSQECLLAASALRLRYRTLSAFGITSIATTLRHELVELGLVLGLPQALEEIEELLLLFLEPPQRLFAILIEGAVAA